MLDADMIQYYVNIVSYGGIVLLPCTCKKINMSICHPRCWFMLSVTYVDLSEQYVDLSEQYVHFSEQYVDLSEQYVDLSGKHHQH